MFCTVAEYILTFGRVPRQPRIISRSAHWYPSLKPLTGAPHYLFTVASSPHKTKLATQKHQIHTCSHSSFLLQSYKTFNELLPIIRYYINIFKSKLKKWVKVNVNLPLLSDDD